LTLVGSLRTVCEVSATGFIVAERKRYEAIVREAGMTVE